ncbi:HXXEE domain-containing protein [Variovorax sp. J31P207]|uniref:HXXEE domain-containing protein n=1 Tax=Variovorax sp. J31P207 TaxID=3053510 RepID=UPI002578C215|nr:HXXEE domain-containing protein [Variovorax sp. J31P207]MDM0070545.1 HXXEE domain-containing protein [Variovorax sp. J31P207]
MTASIKLQRSTTGITFEMLIWLWPITFAPHIVEEFIGDFSHYVANTMGGFVMPAPIFLANNAFFMLILVGLCTWATLRPSPRSAFWLTCWASGNTFWDFFCHLYYTAASGHYSPGLVTSVLLYYPIPLLISYVGIRQQRLSLRATLWAYAVGLLLLLFVIWGGVHHFAT